MSEYTCDNFAYQEECGIMDGGTYIPAEETTHTAYVVVVVKGKEDWDVLADDLKGENEADQLKREYLAIHPKANVLVDSYQYETESY